MSAKQLDQSIEHWFQEKYQCTLDFEIDDALKKLVRLDIVSVDNDQYQALADPWRCHRA